MCVCAHAFLYISRQFIKTSLSILSLQLFNFDLEVKPILEVLVGKTVEQALLEVMEEEELASLREQQVKYEVVHHVSATCGVHCSCDNKQTEWCMNCLIWYLYLVLVYKINVIPPTVV